VTFDDPERRNIPNRCVITPNSVAFDADYVLARGYNDTFCGRNVRRPNNVVLAMCHSWRYWQGITLSESVSEALDPLSLAKI